MKKPEEADTANVNKRSVYEIYQQTNGNNDTINGKLMTPIYFGYNSFELTASYKVYLQKIAQGFLNDRKRKRQIEVSGHSDCLGTNEYNFILSKKRAEVVKDYLKQLGIKNNQLKVKAEGNTQPYINCNCDNCDEKQHQKNRRVEVRMLDFYSN